MNLLQSAPFTVAGLFLLKVLDEGAPHDQIFMLASGCIIGAMALCRNDYGVRFAGC
jgi:hypothetical protein